MIVTVPMYRVVCDSTDCSASPQDGGEFYAYLDASGARSDAEESDEWYLSETEDRHLCPKHAPTFCGECDKKHETEPCP